MNRKMHLVVSVSEEQYDNAFEFYQKLFTDIVPMTGYVQLGNGQYVQGAQFYADYVNFYLVIGNQISDQLGIDHIGIEFKDADEAAAVRESLDGTRWQRDPYAKTTFELFQAGTVDE